MKHNICFVIKYFILYTFIISYESKIEIGNIQYNIQMLNSKIIVVLTIILYFVVCIINTQF